MNETDEYILGAIRVWIWSGFYSPESVQHLISDLLENDADEEMLRAAVEPEFAKKAEAEEYWPAVTDCDRLIDAFMTIHALHIIALHNAGYTMSDGLSDVGDEYERYSRIQIGYCFYHFQDVERAIDGGGLSIAYGSFEEDPEETVAIGRQVADVLRDNRFKVEWDGDPKVRLTIPDFDWKRRYRLRR